MKAFAAEGESADPETSMSARISEGYPEGFLDLFTIDQTAAVFDDYYWDDLADQRIFEYEGYDAVALKNPTLEELSNLWSGGALSLAPHTIDQTAAVFDDYYWDDLADQRIFEYEGYDAVALKNPTLEELMALFAGGAIVLAKSTFEDEATGLVFEIADADAKTVVVGQSNPKSTLTPNALGESFDLKNLKDGKLTIPETVVHDDQVYRVVGIAPYAFHVEETKSNNPYLGLIEVDIPEGIQTIGDYAFSGQKVLEKADLPSTVTTVGEFAFQKTAIVSDPFEHADSLTKIGQNAYSGCNLQSVDLPKSLKSIGSSAFGSNALLKTLAIPAGVSSLASTIASSTTAASIDSRKGVTAFYVYSSQWEKSGTGLSPFSKGKESMSGRSRAQADVYAWANSSNEEATAKAAQEGEVGSYRNFAVLQNSNGDASSCTGSVEPGVEHEANVLVAGKDVMAEEPVAVKSYEDLTVSVKPSGNGVGAWTLAEDDDYTIEFKSGDASVAKPVDPGIYTATITGNGVTAFGTLALEFTIVDPADAGESTDGAGEDAGETDEGTGSEVEDAAEVIDIATLKCRISVGRVGDTVPQVEIFHPVVFNEAGNIAKNPVYLNYKRDYTLVVHNADGVRTTAKKAAENPGTYSVDVVGMGAYCGTVENLQWVVKQRDTYDYQGFTFAYTLNEDGEATIADVVACDGTTTDLVVPSRIKVGKKYYPVTCIGQYALAADGAVGSAMLRLSSVTIEQGPTLIGACAFSGLRVSRDAGGSGNVQLPDTVTYIGNQAFGSVDIEGELNIPASVEVIGSRGLGGQVGRLAFAEDSTYMLDYVIRDWQGNILEAQKGSGDDLMGNSYAVNDDGETFCVPIYTDNGGPNFKEVVFSAAATAEYVPVLNGALKNTVAYHTGMGLEEVYFMGNAAVPKADKPNAFRLFPENSVYHPAGTTVHGWGTSDSLMAKYVATASSDVAGENRYMDKAVGAWRFKPFAVLGDSYTYEYGFDKEEGKIVPVTYEGNTAVTVTTATADGQALPTPIMTDAAVHVSYAVTRDDGKVQDFSYALSPDNYDYEFLDAEGNPLTEDAPYVEGSEYQVKVTGKQNPGGDYCFGEAVYRFTMGSNEEAELVPPVSPVDPDPVDPAPVDPVDPTPADPTPVTPPLVTPTTPGLSGSTSTPTPTKPSTSATASTLKKPTLKFSKKTVTKPIGLAAFTLKATATKGLKVSYKSSNTKVAKVNANGKVTIVGKGTVTITASTAKTGTYQAAKATYTLKVTKLSKAAISKVTKGKKAFTVKYKKVAGAKGYQIRYSTKSSMKGSKLVKVTKASTLKKKVSKLKGGKKYYVQVRAYTKVNGKTYYGAWSTKKSITPKK